MPEQVLLERIRKRGSEGSGRSDDNEKIASNRLQVYWRETAPVAGFYKDLGLVKEIDGLGTVEEVKERIQQSL